MARMTENRKKKRQRLSGTADTEALHTSETPVTSKLDSKVPQQSVDGDVKMRDATEESKPERVLRPRSKESPLEVSPEHSKKAQTDEHGNRVVDTLLSLQQLKESERHEEKGDPNMKALPHLPAKVSGRHVVGSEPRDLSITGKQPTSPTQLDSLKTYIENLGGVLEDGWHVDAQRSNSGRLIKTFISPSKERFRSRVEVAKHMGLSTNQAKNSQLASTHLQSNSQMISRQIDCENTQGKKATGDGVTLGKRLLEGPNIHVHSQDHSKLDFAGQSKKDRSFIPAQSHGKAVLNTNASATLASDTMKKMEDVSKLHVASTKSPSASFITQRCQDALRSIISTDNFAALSNMLNRGSPSGSLEATLQLKAAPLVARSLDLQLIHLRLSTGAYGQTPELFSADIQQVWKNIISAGNELVTLAHSLSELSDNLYKQQIMSLFQDPSGERVTSSSAIPSKEMSEGKEPLPLSSQHGKESIDHNGLSLHKSQISEENLVVPPSKKTPARPIDILEMGTSGEEVTPSESTPERPANTLDKGSSGQEITLATHQAVQSSSQEFNFHSKKAAAKSRPQKSKKRPKNASKSTSPQALRVVIADNTTASVCKKCGLEQGTECILCEQCSAGYHTHCIDSTSNSLAASGWCCPSCMSKEFMESPCTGILDKGAVVKETREELFLMSSDATSETSRELLKTTGKAGVCEACKKEDDSVLLCDACDAAYHMNCLTPAIDSVPDGYWYCPTCVEEQKKSVVSHEDANHTDVHNCSVCDRISRDSLLPTENESAEHLDFKDTPPVHILGKVSLEQSVEHGCEEHSVEHGCEERSVEHGSPEPSAENGSPELAFLLENENACKVCGIESKKSAVSCSGCLKRYHLSCLRPSLKKLPRRTWYCPSCLCRTCKIDADDDKILLCDACDEGYHTYCLNPPLAEIPEGAWFCPSCAKSKNMVPNSPRQTEVSKRKRKSTEPRRSI